MFLEKLVSLQKDSHAQVASVFNLLFFLMQNFPEVLIC